MKKVEGIRHGAHGKQICLNGPSIALAMCISLFLAACGGGNVAGEDNLSVKTNAADASQKREWVYVPEVVTVGEEHADYGRMQPVGDTFCYVSQEGDADNGAKSICRYFLADRKLVSAPIDFPEGGENWDIGVRCFGQDCNVYLTANVYPADYSSMKRYLCKFDSGGNCLFFRDITEQIGEGASLDRITMDGQGRLYIFANDGEILLYTGDGEYHGSVSCNSPESPVFIQVKGACSGADGKYYACVSKEREVIVGKTTDGEGGSCTLLEINFDEARLSETAGDLPDIKGFCAGKQYDFLMYDERAVYGFDLAAQTNYSGMAGEELFTWMDSDINGYCVTNLYLLESGKLCATVEDWGNEDRAIVILEEIKADQAPKREELTLVTVDGESDLAAMAVKFNRSNDRYHLTVKHYKSLTDLYNAVLTKEPMDLVDLSGVNVQKLAAQGFFEDLAPYVDQSETFGQTDFLDGILDVYTFDGTLVGIPASFTLRTVVGSRVRQENQLGLTLEELLTSADRYPGALAFNGVTKEEMMQYIMIFNEDTFIDSDTGNCHFDSDLFKAVLEYVNQFPDSLGNDMEEGSLPVKIKNGEVLFAIAELDGLRVYQEFEGMFGEDAACVGFPTSDGRGGHLLFTGDAYAIAVQSRHKEGAWKFIEGFLAQEKSESYYHGQRGFFSNSFPTLKKELDGKIEEAIEADSQYGSGKFPERIYSDGTFFQFHALTRDEVDVMLDLVSDAKPYFAVEGDDIIRIISEEASGCYSGQRGIEDVADVIQNRIQLYMNENMK